jgi:hypothetical protein
MRMPCAAAETPVRRAVADAEAAERRLGQLKAEKERVMRQVGGCAC